MTDTFNDVKKRYSRRRIHEDAARGPKEKFVLRFVKGFSSGVGLYAGVKLVTALLRNPFRERFVSFCLHEIRVCPT